MTCTRKTCLKKIKVYNAFRNNYHLAIDLSASVSFDDELQREVYNQKLIRKL